MATFADAIVLSGRLEVQKIAGENLKMKGVSNVVNAATDAEAIDALGQYAKALLIIDWELGAAPCANVLTHNRRKQVPQLRVILLIAAQVTEQLIATAAEYGVTQIFTEQLTAKNLAGRLAGLMVGESMPSDMKKALLEAADARKGGDHKGAFNILQKLWKANPTNLRIRCEVADALMRLEEWENAIKVLEGMDKTKPPYLRGIHLLGRCMMKLGRNDQAVQVLEVANLFNPHDVDRLVDIGNALLQQDKVDEASKQFDAALSVDSEFKPAKAGKGQTQLMDGHVNDALEMLKDAATDVELASMFNTAAVLNMRRGKHDQGMSLYQSAMKALAKNEKLQARLQFNMGLGYRRQHKQDEALACFERAMKLDPSFTKAKEQAMVVAPIGKKAPAPKPAADDKEAPLPAATPKPVGGELLPMVDLGTDLGSAFDEDDLEESLY